MKKTTTFLTKIIIQGTKLKTYEENIKEFAIEVREGTSVAPSNTKLKSVLIPAEKYGSFQFKGTRDITIDNLVVGTYYWFRVKNIRNDGTSRGWQEWTSEQAGDTTNLLTFSTPTVTNTSTATTFSVTPNNIPSDFEQFEWAITETTASLNADASIPPASPVAPAIDYVPDYITTNTNDVSISLTKNRTTWFYCWVRALDTSGNIGTDGWYYIGAGKLLTIDPQSDQDNTPPVSTMGYMEYNV